MKQALAKLNPINSLFGRIFLWFWLCALLIISGNFWLASQLAERSEVKPASERKREMLVRLSEELSNVSSRARGEVKLSRLLERVGRRRELFLLLIEPQSKEYVYDFPQRFRPGKELLNPLVEQSLAYQVRTVASEFVGPVEVSLNGRDYKLFVGKATPGAIGFLRQRHPILPIAIALTISALLCGLFTWSLLRPIRQIKSATYKMSTGDLAARVGNAAKRHDELGQLGREFNEMAEQVERLLLSQKRLLADVSHELRSPLARLQVAIGIAQQQLNDTENSSWPSQLARIEKESHRIEQMLAKVMMLARLEGAPQVQKSQVSLSRLLQEIVEDCQFEAAHVNKVLQSKINDNIQLNADAELLHSAVENVLRNAIKYANNNIFVEAQNTAEGISIQIADDGNGVPEADLAHIFTPFYRVSLSRNRNSGGTGLGLAIATQAIAAHNGVIAAENSQEGGLLIRITLPIE